MSMPSLVGIGFIPAAYDTLARVNRHLERKRFVAFQRAFRKRCNRR